MGDHLLVIGLLTGHFLYQIGNMTLNLRIVCYIVKLVCKNNIVIAVVKADKKNTPVRGVGLVVPGFGRNDGKRVAVEIILLTADFGGSAAGQIKYNLMAGVLVELYLHAPFLGSLIHKI